MGRYVSISCAFRSPEMQERQLERLVPNIIASNAEYKRIVNM